MIAILPFEPQHVARIAVQAAQHGEAERFGWRPGAAADLGPAFTAAETDQDGRIVRVLACGGLAENNPDYATAWGLFAAGIGPGMVAIARAVRRVLDESLYRRVDMLVDRRFAEGRRFAALLGFEHDYDVYARTSAPLLERMG